MFFWCKASIHIYQKDNIRISKHLINLSSSFSEALPSDKVLRLKVMLLQIMFLYTFLKVFISGSWQLFNTKNRFYIPEVRSPYGCHYLSEVLFTRIIIYSIYIIFVFSDSVLCKFSLKFVSSGSLSDWHLNKFRITMIQVNIWIIFTSWISISQITYL